MTGCGIVATLHSCLRLFKMGKKSPISETHPHLLEEWDFDKNRLLNLDPEKLTYGNGKRALWLCKEGHRWVSAIKDRARGSGCPSCSGRAVSDKNRLSLFYPGIAQEWHPVKNGNLKPEGVSFGSHKKVWWQCTELHEWKATVKHRTLSNSRCPDCSGRTVSDKNRLSLLYPEVAKEWHPTLNVDLIPSGVSYASNKKVWWLCSQGHEWLSAIYNRAGNNTCCPRCYNGPVSKISQEWLDELGITQEYREFAIKIDGRVYKVDGFDPTGKTIYEFLGDYWHGNPKIFSAGEINPSNKKSFGELYDQTFQRFAELEKAGYKVVYIWESDYKTG